MPAEEKLTTAEMRRKTNKPIMEKKRRERINKCLEELKTIVLRAVNEDSRPNKLEKADILEMTVKYLKTIAPKVDKKDIILADESSSKVHGIVERKTPNGCNDFSENAHFEKIKRERFTPYPRYRQPPVDFMSHAVPAIMNLGSNLRIFDTRVFPRYLPGTRHPGYPSVAISPISSVSSISPSPVQSTCENNPNIAPSPHIAKDFSRSRERETRRAVPALFDRSNHNSSSGEPFAKFPVNSFAVCRKPNEFIWRPWGVASHL